MTSLSSAVRKVTTVVVTYNGMKWLPRCLDSLRASGHPTEVVVVDNASTDGTPGFIRECRQVDKFIPLRENLGFGQGNNVGIRYALRHGADAVFLLNQDAWIETNTLQLLLKQLQLNPGFGILSPLHLKPDSNVLDPPFRVNCAQQTTPSLLVDLAAGSLQSLYLSPFVNAASWLIPSTAIYKVGLFDPIFFHRGEDNNYCQRILYHGFQIGIIPEARISHDRGVRSDEDDEAARIRTFLIDAANVNNLHYKRRMMRLIANEGYKIARSILRADIHHLRWAWRNINRKIQLVPEVIRSVHRNRLEFGAVFDLDTLTKECSE